MKPKPISSMHLATSAGASSIRTPSASRRSAEPHRLRFERLPCLATAHSAPAATSAAAVEMLKVDGPPPVPAVSTRLPRLVSTSDERRRIVRASPISSATVSPFARRAIRKAAVCTSLARPSMTSSRTAVAWSAVRWLPVATSSIARVRISLGIALILAQEVRQQLLAVRRQHRFRVELNAGRRQLAMAYCHHDVGAGRGALQSGRQIGIGDQRVVAPAAQRVRQPREDALAVVGDLGLLAV